MSYGICANIISDTALKAGAKVYILSTNGQRRSVMVTGQSKGGRYITKYVKLSSLTNARSAFIPEHARAENSLLFETKDEAWDAAKSILIVEATE